MYDFHVHSSFSGDCSYSMEDMIKGAIRVGVKSIAFTDHIDYEYGSPDINFVFDVKDYLKDFNKLKNKYGDQLNLLIGAEIGMQPHLSKKNLDFINSCDFDFIIMSTHVVQGSDLHVGNYFKEKSSKDVYEKYYEEVLSNLNSINNFDVVGHLNLIERYVKYMDEKLHLDDYRELMSKVLNEIISMDKGIELNTSGIRYGIESFLPSNEILKLYKELGGETITIGSDAHNPKDICSHYKEAIDVLRSLDYKYITVYKNRKKRFIKID
ncbi:histidinol-phosphatase HisJ family protein [Sporosalibacterium faouarense]|uniref:histidinol-phosphatase HisJ family protein n=1 Tax=Sporosalibacterium faouarense TaxID=516123 RepID=UPI00192C4E78|nr:histidinol-phosphatase HisJ family protein [Sporosalibacterium faouarense]